MLAQLLIILIATNPSLSSSDMLQLNVIFVEFDGGPSIDQNLFLSNLNDSLKFLSANKFPVGVVDLYYNPLVMMPKYNVSYYGENKYITDDNFYELIRELTSEFSKFPEPQNKQLNIIVQNSCDESARGCYADSLWSRYYDDFIIVSNEDPVGVLAHEITHYFGSVDLGYVGGPGKFSLLATGLWNPEEDNYSGKNPAFIDSFTLDLMGWSSLKSATSGRTETLPLENGGSGYKFDNYIIELRDDPFIPANNRLIIYELKSDRLKNGIPFLVANLNQYEEYQGIQYVDGGFQITRTPSIPTNLILTFLSILIFVVLAYVRKRKSKSS